MINKNYYSYYCKEDSCKGEIILADNYYYVCTTCGVVQRYNYYVLEKFEELPTKFPYKCITYFRRILKCMQNKTNSTIPKYIFDLIDKHTTLTPRQVLKKYKLFQFYILLPIIEQTIINKKPILLTDDEERVLCKFFQRIEKQIRRKYPQRKQILRYKPILKRLFIIIGRVDLANLMNDLKSEKARKEFNKIWDSLDI